MERQRTLNERVLEADRSAEESARCNRARRNRPTIDGEAATPRIGIQKGSSSKAVDNWCLDDSLVAQRGRAREVGARYRAYDDGQRIEKDPLWGQPPELNRALRTSLPRNDELSAVEDDVGARRHIACDLEERLVEHHPRSVDSSGQQSQRPHQNAARIDPDRDADRSVRRAANDRRSVGRNTRNQGGRVERLLRAEGWARQSREGPEADAENECAQPTVA